MYHFLQKAIRQLEHSRCVSKLPIHRLTLGTSIRSPERFGSRRHQETTTMTSRTKPAIIPLANLPSDWLCLVSRAQVCSPASSKVGLRWQGLDIVVQGPDCEKVQSRYAMQMPAIFSSVGGPNTLGRARPSFNFGSLSSGVFATRAPTTTIATMTTTTTAR